MLLINIYNLEYVLIRSWTGAIEAWQGFGLDCQSWSSSSRDTRIKVFCNLVWLDC
jgi:hypothetical protein